MKVRDLFIVPRVRTRSLATRYRAPGEPDDSRIATHRLHGEPGIVIACDREFGLHGSYVHRHPIRWPALRWDNKNPRRSLRMDAAGEIYGLQNSGSANVAKECVQAPSPSFAAIERDPQRLVLTINACSEKPYTHTPHLNPLPVSGARRRSARHRPPLIHFDDVFLICSIN